MTNLYARVCWVIDWLCNPLAKSWKVIWNCHANVQEIKVDFLQSGGDIQEVTGVQTFTLPIWGMGVLLLEASRRQHTINPSSPEKDITIERKSVVE